MWPVLGQRHSHDFYSQALLLSHTTLKSWEWEVWGAIELRLYSRERVSLHLIILMLWYNPKKEPPPPPPPISPLPSLSLPTFWGWWEERCGVQGDSPPMNHSSGVQEQTKIMVIHYSVMRITILIIDFFVL